MNTNTERNNMIADDFVDGKSLEEISTAYGLKPRMVTIILREKGLKAVDRKVKTNPRDRQRPKSKLHKSIGERLYDYYFIQKGMNRPQAAEALGVSAKALKGIETGSSVLPLTDLQNIAAFMKTTVGDLTDGS